MQSDAQRDFPHLHAPRDGYVFVVTYGRSGSTLVQHLLNRLPGYCIRGENGDALRPLFETWRWMREAPTHLPMLKRAEPSLPTHPWYGFERVALDRYRKGLADVFVRDVLTPPAGTRVAGFKEIRFGGDAERFDMFLDWIAEVFPRPRFVFNTRSHAATARSGWWRAQDPGDVTRELARQDALFRAYAARRPRITVELRYDDYVADHAALRPLFEFLGEPWDPALVAEVMATRLDHLQRG